MRTHTNARTQIHTRARMLTYTHCRLHAFGPVDVANTVWAFGRLQFNGQQYRVAPDIVRKMLQQAFVVLPLLEPQVSNRACTHIHVCSVCMCVHVPQLR